MQIEIIKKKIDELNKLADEIENYETALIKRAVLLDEHFPTGVPHYGNFRWRIPNGKSKEIQRKTLSLYQKWYSATLELTDSYLTEDRKEEFKNKYNRVINYLQFKSSYSANKKEFIQEFIDEFDIQRGILLGILEVIEVKKMDLRKLISADFVETELDEAELLFKHKFTRAAGALVGVALEKHLKTMCHLNNISYKPKATIDPLATELYRTDYLDIAELKKVQHLASIRNKCDHSEEITKEEVKELIDETKKFIINH